MKILVVDQCSNSKSIPDSSVCFSAAEIDAESLDELRARDGAVSVPARKLYAGRQQRYVGEAVDSLRAGGHSVERYFISAGFGIVSESEELPPYDVSFAEMSDSERADRAEKLGLNDRIRELVSEEAFDVVFFPLGSAYCTAVNLPDVLSELPAKSIGVTFNQEEIVDEYENVISIPARIEEAKAQETIVVALKGVYLKNFAANVARGVSIDTPEDIAVACLEPPTSQVDFDDF